MESSGGRQPQTGSQSQLEAMRFCSVDVVVLGAHIVQRKAAVRSTSSLARLFSGLMGGKAPEEAEQRGEGEGGGAAVDLGRSDPYYAVVRYNALRYVTRAVRDGLDPVWNEDCTFVVRGQRQQLDVAVLRGYPKAASSECVGVGTLDVDGLSGEAGERIVQLVGEDGQEEVGSVSLMVQRFYFSRDGFLVYRGSPLHQLPLRLEAGDLIFFNSSRWVSSTARLLSWSSWDHVGVVVRYKNYKRLMLLEAITSGVALLPLDSNLKAYWEHCNSIGVRRLRMERTPEMVQRLYGIATQLKGKPYNWNPLDTVLGMQAPSDDETPQSLTCAQLANFVYIKLGLLEAQDSLHSLPLALATEDLVLKRGSLAPLVVFDAVRNKAMPEDRLLLHIKSK